MSIDDDDDDDDDSGGGGGLSRRLSRPHLVTIGKK